MKEGSNILKVALFATGMSGIVAEYILSTLATYFLGDSVFQWTMILSIMLFSMGLGSRFSKIFKDNLLQKFVYIEFVLSILTAFVSIITYSASAYYGSPAFIIYILSVAIGLLIGMEIPIVIRLNDQYEELRVNVSSIMEKDYYGSLLGGMFFAFVGLPYLGLTYTPFVLGTINFLVASSLIFVLSEKFKGPMKGQLIWRSVMIFLVLILGVVFAKPIIHHGETVRYKDKVVYEQQSRYQKIVITQSKGDFWLFINGNQQLSTVDEVMYHEPLVHPVMKLLKNPTHVLVMGGGDGGAVREILKYPSVEQITLVDLDPAMTQLGQQHDLLVAMNQNAMNHPKVNILNEDGFNFLEKSEVYYDAIIIDLPDPKSIELGRLYSYEFYKMCYKRLRKAGVLITQAGSPYYAADAFNCIDKTIDDAGFETAKLHNQVITLGEWGWILGVKGMSKESLKSSLQELAFEDIETRWINHAAMTLITSFGKNTFGKDTAKIEVNRIHNPVLYKYYLNGKWDLY
ncbi:MAG: polyamine aminopropyltransferase [Reichenbachiella sp.]